MVFLSNSLSSFRFRRSVLFIPATNQRALEKVPSLNCDCIIIDLEDAISGESKNIAHSNLLKYVKDQDYQNRECIIRIGDLDDLDIALRCQPDAILVPKVGNASALFEISTLMEHAASPSALWAMIETPLGLMNLKEIVEVTDRLHCLVVGPNDLMDRTGVKPENQRSNLHPWLMMIIAAARSKDLGVLDGVYNNFEDESGFEAECLQASKMGFDGKTLIHPNQISKANTVFGFSNEELERARRIMDIFKLPENLNKGVIQMDGEMLERLHLKQAETLIRLSKQE